MTATTYKVPKNSVLLTIFLLVLGAMLGTVIGLFITFLVSGMAAAATGPAAMLVLAPVLIAQAGLSVGLVFVIAPLWALLGGAVFAGLVSGKSGSAARSRGVVFVEEDHPIFEATQAMAKRLNIKPVPYVGWYEADNINAFAAGTRTDNTVIALSKGAIEKLPKNELHAVIAHELGHVASNDMARMTFALGIREALTFFLLFNGLKKAARWVFTPFSELELLRLSRTREFTADAVSAHLTSPEDIIAVLERLKAPEEQSEPAKDDMVMMAAAFSSPWLSTHPPVEDRIAALRKLAQTQTE
jgi:heat shock protein HtpX